LKETKKNKKKSKTKQKKITYFIKILYANEMSKCCKQPENPFLVISLKQIYN